MSLTVSLTKIKDRLGLTGTTYDSKISSLITDWIEILEHAIDPVYLNDTANAGLQSTLNLGAFEMVAGEFSAQLAREPGASESLFFGWLELRPEYRDLADPWGLKAQGASRLGPYLKHTDKLQGSLGVLPGGSRGDEE